MTKRDRNWDYKQPAVYLITLTLSERRQLLGTLIIPEEGDTAKPEDAYVKPTIIGNSVLKGLREMPQYHKEIQVLQYQLMPDHLHIALRVTQAMPMSLGRVIGLFKHRTEENAKAAYEQHAICKQDQDTNTDFSLPMITVPGDQQPTRLPSPNYTFESPLWAPGFNDNRLRTRDQLQHMIAYIKDNPRRLATKQLYKGLFSIRRGVNIADAAYDAVGNMALLMQEKRAVHVRSRWTAEEKRAYKNSCILAAREGTVLTGPFISPDERDVLRVALEERLPLICLQENGFPEIFKPGGELFDACAEGRLLLLAPWPYHSRRQAITRTECLALNRMAEEIANDQIANNGSKASRPQE